MALALLLAFQAAAAPAPPPALAIDFDLARLQRPGLDLAGGRRGCERRPGDEILVCGARPRGDGYPIDEMARRFEPRPLVAQARLFGDVAGRIYLEQVEIAPGLVSNRVMAGVTLRF